MADHEHVYRKEKPRRYGPFTWDVARPTHAKCSCGKRVRLDELVYLATELPKSRRF